MSRKRKNITKKIIKIFGKRLKQLRDEKGWSQENITTECGIDATTLSRIENGKVNISIEYMAAIVFSADEEISDFFNTKEVRELRERFKKSKL